MAQLKTNLNDKYNTGLISDFQRALGETSTTQANINYWEELLQPAQQTYEQTAKQAQVSSGYDITNAYKQYLSQQRGIEGSGLLDTSKSEFSNLAKNQYQTSYAQSQSTLAGNLASAYEQYTKDYQTAYEQLQKEADYTKTIYETALDIASGYTKDDRYTEEELNNMYALNPSTGRYELTDMGKVILGDVFESVDETTDKNVLAQTLRETDEDLYQYYLENKNRVTEALAGYKGTYDYVTGKEEQRLKASGAQLTNDSSTYQAKIGNRTVNFDKVKTIYNYPENSSAFTPIYYDKSVSGTNFINELESYARKKRVTSGDVIDYKGRLYFIKFGPSGSVTNITEVKKKE